MATAVIMPRQGQSVESCIISKWHKKKGDKVNEGDLLFTYETDKATFDEEAKVTGTILEILYDEDDDVPVLENVCVIGEEGENIDEFLSGSDKKDEAEPVEEVKEVQAEVNEPEPVIQSSSGMKISPRAKNLAKKEGIDPAKAESSGPYGRIIEKDIIKLKEEGPKFTQAAKAAYDKDEPVTIPGSGIGGRVTTADIMKKPVQEEAEKSYRDEKLTNIRKLIAKSMHSSLANTAQLTLNASFDASVIMDYRKALKDNKEKMGLSNITLNDIVLFAVTKTLKEFPIMNAHFLDDIIRYYENVNLGVAIDTDRGLMVPTLFNADELSLNEMSASVKVLAQECQKGTINPDLLKDGTFTVTNLGMLDIESFTPVINPPQTGILGVNNIVQKVKEENGEYKYYPAMGLSLTFDHRAVDGAPAARFLKALKSNLENFNVLLAK